MGNYDIDETVLNAYIDGQVDAELEQAVLCALHGSASLREEVSRLRLTKDWIRLGFAAAAPVPRADRYCAGRRAHGLVTALAASLATLMIGVAGGLLGYWCADAPPGEQPQRILLHLDQSEPAQLRTLLDYAEAFLRRKTASGAQLEVVVNAGGIDLVTRGVSPYETRVRAMMQRYPSLHFVACANSIRQQRQTGAETLMISDVHSDQTAIEHIVGRLRDGWSYRKIEQLDTI